jgi:hypothetical protein
MHRRSRPVGSARRRQTTVHPPPVVGGDECSRPTDPTKFGTDGESVVGFVSQLEAIEGPAHSHTESWPAWGDVGSHGRNEF